MASKVTVLGNGGAQGHWGGTTPRGDIPVAGAGHTGPSTQGVGLGTEWKSGPIHLANVFTAWDSFQRIALIWADRRPAVWQAQDGDPGINRSHWGAWGGCNASPNRP